MGQMKLVDQAPISARLLERIQIRALEILDERENQHGPIVEIANDRRNLSPAEVGGGPHATLAGNQLEGVAVAANADRLQQATRLKRRLEFPAAPSASNSRLG